MRWDEDIEQRLSDLRFQLDMMWYSMMGGMVLYGLVLVFADKTILKWRPPFTTFDLWLSIGAVIALVSSMVLELRTLNIESVVQKLMLVFVDSDQRRGKVLRSSLRFYYKVKVWQWGMVEAICIMGFISSYKSENINPYVLGLVIAELAIIIYRPKIDDYLEKVQRELLR